MTDERIRRLLEAAEQPLAPSPDFASGLLDELKAELGFAHTATTGIRPGPKRRDTRRTTGRLPGLIAAAILVLGALGTLSMLGSLSRRPPAPSPDPLAAIVARGRITIAVRPDHPQVQLAGVPPAGFDVDVAGAIAERLGVDPAIEIATPSDMLGNGVANWDVALPSVPSWSVDATRIEVSVPYYYWRHHLVVTQASDVTAVADLAGQSVCAVSDDAGESWLRGEYGNETAAPRPVTIVTRASDADCLAALSAGEVAAAVTATMSNADVEVRPGVRVMDGPAAEPRSVIVPRGSTPISLRSPLLDAIDRAIAELHDDGTLTRLAQNRFGGDDVSKP